MNEDITNWERGCYMGQRDRVLWVHGGSISHVEYGDRILAI